MYPIAQIRYLKPVGQPAGSIRNDADGQEPQNREPPPYCTLETPLRPFENLPPAYDPSTWWLDGQVSAYPYFRDG
ncbi:uncharacterized protein N7525_002572 [Penicillium rubens]|uniref:uncharacterized protein n=1 Tax=Penicillium rubens TaxID=1108849 RepID=UPI002A59E759|nr:uncharacterized protein N7525_002572 [Penicillium rubens]KAJ5837384.1 hypothetical protein N7525_002572 [Penicillium rubens]KAJ5865573.1 hypothetical protein N7534_000126 [Penicillium rubens]